MEDKNCCCGSKAPCLSSWKFDKALENFFHEQRFQEFRCRTLDVLYKQQPRDEMLIELMNTAWLQRAVNGKADIMIAFPRKFSCMENYFDSRKDIIQKYFLEVYPKYASFGYMFLDKGTIL